MLKDNIEIKRENGEYKDFPYKYRLYLYGWCVWEDDFNENLSDKKIIEKFIDDCYLAGISPVTVKNKNTMIFANMR